MDKGFLETEKHCLYLTIENEKKINQKTYQNMCIQFQLLVSMKLMELTLELRNGSLQLSIEGTGFFQVIGH